MGRPLKTLFFLALVLVVAAGGVLAWGHAQYARPGPLAEETAVVIEHGQGIESIAMTLAAAGVVARPMVFELAARWRSRTAPLKAGEFAFPAGASVKDAIEILQSGTTVVHRLTAAEGLTTAEIMALVMSAEGLVGTVAPVPPEGALLPETYHYAYGDRRQDLVQRMRDAMRGLMEKLWPARDPDVQLKSPSDALILASIVEKETAVAAERPRIAAVFLNRLQRGMRLQSDPTVVYGLTAGEGPLGRPLTRADLTKPTPYNTYLIGGLPPTPISNPGAAALESVLRPAKTKDLYFVADGSGGHVFSATLKEHNRNVAKWRRLHRKP